jgi:hypothetical protein
MEAGHDPEVVAVHGLGVPLLCGTRELRRLARPPAPLPFDVWGEPLVERVLDVPAKRVVRIEAVAGLAEDLLWTLGVSISAVFAAFLVHLLIAYPRGELDSRWERVVVAAGYVLAGSANLLLLLFEPRPIDDCEECPDNAFLVRENETASDLLTALVEGFAVVYLLAGTIDRDGRQR